VAAQASYEERILLCRLDLKVVNLLNMANALDELGKLAERYSSPVTAIVDHRCKGAAVWRIRTEGDFRMILDDSPKLQQLESISAPSALERAATLELWSSRECDLGERR
jgi:hypothetical protein